MTLRHHVPVPANVEIAVEPAAPQVDRTEADWYKDAIVYQLHIKAFRDGNGDGIGDFAGLMSQLDYVQQLGVTAIWLLPFYPSPLRDDGYDIADYKSVHPSYGSLDDFKQFVAAAHERGIRVITELVINHTSDSHPWFQRARKAPAGSSERNFYVWSDTEDRYTETRIIFLDTETSNWTWDPVAKAYFWHRFYSHQPDLNFDNPAVFDEVVAAMRFWLDLGVDGLRLDAVPYLCERDGTNNENLPETHAILRRIRAEIDAHYPDRMLLAEANQWPEDTRPYFGEGDECHMAFHFPLMPRMYMALAQEDRHPITDILRQTPEIPDSCQWALFLRNHDELTLEMVTAEERDYLWKTYAADPRARINLGIRRRLATLLDNDRRKIELLNVLLFSMPGTPVIYYGDELGMGDNYYLGDRDGVRTPMQWSVDRNAGFSRADPQRLYLPVLMDAVFGYQAVNVESQHGDASSLLNWMRRMIAVRRNHKAFGRGSLTFLYPRNRRVIAFLREHDGETLLVVANLSRSAQAIELDLASFRGLVPVELTGGAAFPPIGAAPYVLTLPAFGSFWFQLARETEMPRWHIPAVEPLPQLMTLVMSEGWSSLLTAREARHLERDVLAAYLPRQRWFGFKNETVSTVSITPLGPLAGNRGDHMLATIRVALANGTEHDYLLPLSLDWSEGPPSDNPARAYALAKVRRGPRIAVLADGATDERFVSAIVRALRAGAQTPLDASELRFLPTTALAGLEIGPEAKILRAEQSNASAIVGDAVLLKLYRRLEAGIQPELEMAHFLTEVARFASTPTFLGAIEHVGPDGTRTALGGAFAYVPNQGDGWSVVTDALARMLEHEALGPGSGELPGFAFPLDIGAIAGERTAEMHFALATPTDDFAFSAEPVGHDDIRRWVDDTRLEAARMFTALDAADVAQFGDGPRAAIEQLQGSRSRIETVLTALEALAPSGEKIRHHGDYHLGQVLIVKDDLMIVDFEGEPTRSLEERRRKTSPLRDLAGMLRSIDYAAWSAIDRAAARNAGSDEPIRALAFRWRDKVLDDCVSAYVARASGQSWYPENKETAAGLLTIFLLRKAFYEVQYEIGSRPAWLSIPVRGIMNLIDKIGGAS